jgi:hypothetical protein
MRMKMGDLGLMPSLPRSVREWAEMGRKWGGVVSCVAHAANNDATSGASTNRAIAVRPRQDMFGQEVFNQALGELDPINFALAPCPLRVIRLLVVKLSDRTVPA